VKTIVFVTGTRADYSKQKSLIRISKKAFKTHIWVTGMHLHEKYGYTVNEIQNDFPDLEIIKFQNFKESESHDLILSNTLTGFKTYIDEYRPDLIIVHGDRVEALGATISGAFNNVLTGHIEGGELSGTIDESLRHATSKLANIHFVSNQQSKNRLIQLGEDINSIFIIGSPDLDIMNSESLPSLREVKLKYNISFDEYGIIMFHPVTTDWENFSVYTRNLMTAVKQSKRNFVIIFPNNDKGSSLIFNEYERYYQDNQFKFIPSMRFEFFLRLLKETQVLIGNSSAGIREAPAYGVPVINVGNRQYRRSTNQAIINTDYEMESIKNALEHSIVPVQSSKEFGDGKSDLLFYKILMEKRFWDTPLQKSFIDIN